MSVDVPFHVETPVWERDDRAFAGRRLLYKMDALQPCGSFKLRGVGAWFVQAMDAGVERVICPSGGNAGFAAAWCGRQSGMPVTIVVPETTSAEARDSIMRAGAEVVVHGAAFDEASAHARALADAGAGAFLHPFDDPLLWQGHGTLIDEIVAADIDFDCVVTSVGGGGLLIGILEGLARNGLGHIPVFAVETAGAASLHASLAQGRIVTLPAITSVATSLGARRVADTAFQLARAQAVTSLVVSDADAVGGCLDFADEMRVLVEPACGAALAALQVHADRFASFKRPLIEVCGGIGVTAGKLEGWRRQFASA
jgi:L-serine/L-threonine ammonia-lyase